MDNNKKYDVKFWNSFVPFFPSRSFIQMTMKVKIDDAIKDLQEAKKRADADGCITLEFLKKKADETKLYSKETIWHDTNKIASDTALEHMPRAKPDNII
tara:strand:+ start:1068 stop:1364 length:297 start_codon:yes stop_codon:yes gene_type:complete